MSSEEDIERLICRGGSVKGLFESKRGDMNMLTNPLVLAHLRSIHDQASDRPSDMDSLQGVQTNTEDENAEILTERITAYNRRNGRESFSILQKGLVYEGPIHVSTEDTSHKITKVLQVTNHVTVEQLLPILVQKFNISKNDKRRKVLYQTHESDEILLSKEERPLEIVVNAEHNIRFIFKMENVIDNQETYPFDVETGNNHKHLSKFFGVSSDELNAALSPSLPSNVSKWKPGWFKKHQGAGDELSLSSNSSGGSGQQAKMIDEYNNDGVKGLMLKPQSPQYRRKSEILAEPPKIQSIKSKKEKHKVKQRPKSISGALERRFNRKKKVALNCEVELSFDECTPGIIKVFGEEITSGATYKCVLVSEQSTAEGIIKEILDRHSLSKEDSGEYVLCDVVGKLDTRKVVGKGQKKVVFEESDWHMEYLRIVENHERPLLLQGFWKPCDGCSRRFEIRRRSKCVVTDQDNITSGLNENAKRFQMHRTKVPPQQSNVELEGSGNINQIDKKLPEKSEREETESSDEHTDMYHLPVPHDFPYLLNIKGSGDNKDLLCYPINSPLTIIGKGHSDQNDHQQNIDHHADIILTASDIRIKHCKIITQTEYISYDQDVEETLFDVFLQSFPSAVVHVNGNFIKEKTQLYNGDLIGIGDDYLFIFKNPTEENTEHTSWLDESLNMSKLESSSSEVRNIHPNLKPFADEYNSDSGRMKIIYSKDVEDDLLPQVLPMACDGDFPLIPAFVFTMCIEYTAYHRNQDETKGLLCKIANLMQNEAWLKTKALASLQPEKPVEIQEALATLIPNLQPIVIWMSNALELLNHLQKHIHEYIVINEDVSRPLSSSSSSDFTSTIDEEVLSVLEEIVMYTFQQSVYYLTKTLYTGLPIVFDSSPFVNDNDSDDENNHEEKVLGINAVLNVFQATFDLLKSLNVHHQITKQLFAYLLFFTNASLFNMLMERGPGRKSFKWSKGVQIRGNLDYIESWIHDKGLQDISHFLGLISTAADLLATPKIQLMQATWSSLRHDFPCLNPSQLQHILGEYQLGSGKTRPEGWYPPPDQIEGALKTDEILEGFNNHPPLTLPSTGCVLQLGKQVTNTAFYSQLQALSSTLPTITIETGNSELLPPSTKLEKKIQSGRQSPQLVRQDAHETANCTDETAEEKEEKVLKTTERKAENEKSVDKLGTDVDMNNVQVNNNNSHGFKQTIDLHSPAQIMNQVKSKKQDVRNGNVQTNGSLVAAQMRHKEVSSISSKRTYVQKIRGEGVETKRTPSYCSAMAHRRHSGDFSALMQIDSSISRDGGDVKSMKTKTLPNMKVTELQETPSVEVTPPNWDKSIPLLEGKTGVIPPPPGWTSNMEKRNTISDLENNNTDKVSKTGVEGSTETQKKKSQSGSIGGSLNEPDDVFVVDLEKENGGVGLGLIDGMFTPLRAPGIYVRTLLPAGAAAVDGRLRMGDRILAVNGTTLVGADYQSAMQLIRSSGVTLSFLVARSDNNIAGKISNSSC